MAFAARSVAATTEENNVLGLKETKAGINKGQSLLQQGSKRRAPLGDMSNLGGALNNRSHVGKENGKPAEVTKVKAAVVRAKAEVAPAPVDVVSAGLVPRTRSQTLAARQSGGGLSMTSLLESRSMAASTGRRSSAPPASPVPDIDAQDRANPLAAPEYVNDIYAYFKRVEPKYRVAPDYMSAQGDINEKMRAILVDWLVEVHNKFKLVPETLFLTVNLIDRFLAVKQVTRRNLQLVGVTAMLIASKYEEVWAPEVRDYVYISDKAYTRDQILAMEKLMLNTLQFNLTLPTPYNFQLRFLKAAGMYTDKQVGALTAYLLELSMVDASMLKYSYSMVSAAAAYVAMEALDKPDCFPKALAHHCGYSKDQVQPCAMALVQLMQKAPTATLTAVHKKYSHAKFLEVAKTEAPVEILSESNRS